MNNKAVASLPKHLLQFAVDQRYDDYTPVDHAVWRFIMRQNMFFLRNTRTKLYFQGLLDTGISFDRIPRIEEMNDILGKIGWGGVAVDGFIPPAAFMEFQAYRGPRDRVRHAPDQSHRIHAGAGHRARSGGTCPDHCRPGILGLFAAVRRSRREGDVVQERFRAL